MIFLAGDWVVRRMTATPPGIARDSCPFCGERPRLRWSDYLPSPAGGYVRCNHCGKRLCLSVESGLLGIIVGAVVGLGLIFGLAEHLSRSVDIALGTAAWLVVCGVVVRLTIRLDPPEVR